MRIEWYDPRSGVELGSTAVAATIAPQLSVSGGKIVYRTGRTISVLDSANGKRSIVTTASATPIGLTIEGSRIAWGENIAGRGRIMALQIPLG